jgi:hypothetical protein
MQMAIFFFVQQVYFKYLIIMIITFREAARVFLIPLSFDVFNCMVLINILIKKYI